MQKKIKHLVIITATIIIFLSASFIFKSQLLNLYAFSRTALSNYGSSGQEVVNIQSKLRNWGYYKGGVDGIYGYDTFKSVQHFQANNGLTPDGICGDGTLTALGLPTGDKPKNNKKPGQTGNSYNGDVNLLARLIHGEARGEPYNGQVSVGAVILNRTRDSRFPKTLAGVIYQPGAFDAVDDGQINLEPDTASINAARDALNGWDPTGGCVFYWNPATATSKWIWSRPVVCQIGRHVFAR